MTTPKWLREHRAKNHGATNIRSRVSAGGWGPERNPARAASPNPVVRDVSFNRHSMNDGSHVSPYDNGKVQVGLDGLEVRLLQGVDEGSFKRVVSRATRATTGLPVPKPGELADEDWEEMMGGGLQAALETQVIVFEVWGASRALTHQLVRSRQAGFHQQSQRATYYGDAPEVRMPESIWNSTPDVREAWYDAILASQRAYRMACEADVSYQDARYILTEGTTNYIQCEYSVREFINVFAYRGCSMFLWEMVGAMRMMRDAFIAAHPMFEPYVKISCEKGFLCHGCLGSGYVHSDGVAATAEEWANVEAGGDPGPYTIRVCQDCHGLGGERKCTFQGWESVEGQCSFPWAKQSNRTFLPSPKFRIGAS